MPLSVGAPLTTPENFKPEATPQGVALIWTAPAGATQFRIYRKAPDAANTPAMLATSDQPSYTDTTAEFGKTYSILR